MSFLAIFGAVALSLLAIFGVGWALLWLLAKANGMP